MHGNFGHFGFVADLSLDSLSHQSKLPSGTEYGTDITLQFDSPGTYNSNSKGTKRKWGDTNGIEIPYHVSLDLGLGCPSSSSDNSKVSSATFCPMSSAKEITDESSSVDLGLNFELQLGSDDTFSRKNPSITKALESGQMFDLKLSLSTRPSKYSISTLASALQNSFDTSVTMSPVPTVDEEGSTSSQWKIPYLSSTMTQTMKSPAVTHLQQRNTSTKSCQFQGCGKGARGASGLCIAHGGGRRCQKAGCHKGAEGRTVYCKAHGGGRRCEHLGCTKSAEGRTDYCIAHGGGHRCSHDEGCTRAARGKSGLCIRHGGGKRCQRENCTKSAEGYSGLCISHGGGRRCQVPSCTKGAQGSTLFCKAHGGGKRCTVLGCTKGAEGSTAFCKGHGGGKRCLFEGGGCPKSVHGGTRFCVAHGGGKRCAVPECTKSARGRTDFCVRHGGGKRCRSEGCGKSAQGSTDFCKAHGGGKRCSWGQPGSEGCDRFARGKIGLCAAHSALLEDHRVHGEGKLGPPASQLSTFSELEKVKVVDAEREIFSEMGDGGESFMFSVPGGSGKRVHGGSQAYALVHRWM